MTEDHGSSAFHLPKISSVCYLTAANNISTTSPPTKRRVRDNNKNTTYKITNNSFDNNNSNNSYIFRNANNNSFDNSHNTTNNNRKNSSSLYTLHCFYKLASEELSPAYRKQAVVEDNRTSEDTLDTESTKDKHQGHRSKKRGGGEPNNTNKKHNKQVGFSSVVTRKKDNAKRKVDACNKFKDGARRKRKDRSVTLLETSIAEEDTTVK